MPPPLTIRLPGGVQVPVSKWAVTGFSVIALVAVAFGIYRYFYPPLEQLVTVRQANEQLRLEIDHYNLHIVDEPTVVLEDNSEMVSVRGYRDRCLVISRRFGQTAATRLLIDITARPVASTYLPSSWSVAPVVSAAQRRPPKCLNPHPGTFTWQYGDKKDQCWVEVVRSFEDGCVHIQMFNACTRGWDTNRDGSPRVSWKRCIH